MGGDKLVCRLHVLCVAPLVGKRQLFLWGKHREFADLLEIPRQVAFWGDIKDGRDHEGNSFRQTASACPDMAQDRGMNVAEATPDAGIEFKSRLPAPRGSGISGPFTEQGHPPDSGCWLCWTKLVLSRLRNG